MRLVAPEEAVRYPMERAAFATALGYLARPCS